MVSENRVRVEFFPDRGAGFCCAGTSGVRLRQHGQLMRRLVGDWGRGMAIARRNEARCHELIKQGRLRRGGCRRSPALDGGHQGRTGHSNWLSVEFFEFTNDTLMHHSGLCA